MDIEKNAYVESDSVRNINEIAGKAYELKSDKDVRYRTEYNKLAAMVLDMSSGYKPQNIEAGDFQECIGDTFIECFKKWVPGNAAFWPYFISILKKRIPGIYLNNLDTFYRGSYKKMKRMKIDSAELTEEQKASLKPDISREDFYSNSDEDNTVKNIPDKVNTENDALQVDAVNNLFSVLNKAILTQKKKYENSTKPCYAVYFYTEFVTRRIEEENNKYVFAKAESELMKVVDHDFISYYMIGDNSSITGISLGKLKKVSVFTNDPSDNRPCGYDIENIVYAKYISMLKKSDKVQSGSSISQQRAKFNQFIQLEMKNSFDKY